MNTIDTTVIIGFILLVALFIMVIIQNNTLLRHADHRLDKANEMVLKLAHSADTLSNSVSQLKDMLVHIEQLSNTTTTCVAQNRDEYKEAYAKLLTRYTALQDKFESELKEHKALVHEMARRPFLTNTNTNTNTNANANGAQR